MYFCISKIKWIVANTIKSHWGGKGHLMTKSDAMLWIYLHNFPSVIMHYEGGCKDPHHIESKIPIRNLKLPDAWHISPDGNLVRHNPISWIPVEAR